MDSNELLSNIRKVTKMRKESVEWEMTLAINGPLARLIVQIDDLDRRLSTGYVLPVAWEPAWTATTDEMARQNEE